MVHDNTPTVAADFRHIPVKDIEGNTITLDVARQIGNLLYMQGMDIEECEAGRRIYYAEGPVELTQREVQAVLRVCGVFGYMARKAIEDALCNRQQK